jgi:DNA-binding XRE family transcriptional regulator
MSCELFRNAVYETKSLNGSGDRIVPLEKVFCRGEYRIRPLLDGEKTHAGIPQAVVEAHVLRAVPVIRAWREHLGITQGALAERMGVSQAAVAKLEKPGAKSRRTTLERVATALGISVAQLDV